MFDFLKSLFNPAPPSGSMAKERLRLVLLSDHLSLAPDVVEALKKDLLAVISRYVTIDSAHADVTFEHRENEVAMLANIPITGVRERERPTSYDATPPKSSDAAASVAVAVAEPVVEMLAEPTMHVEAEPVLPVAREPARKTTMPLATDVAPGADANPIANANAAAVPGKAAQRRRRRKKASNALANSAERKAAAPPQPGYSAQA